MLAKNKSSWILEDYLYIDEAEIDHYENVTGAFAIIFVGDKVLLGYNAWRKQWELPAGGIENGETARQAAIRELKEESHQENHELRFSGLAKIQKPNGLTCYQAVYVGNHIELTPFHKREGDEMEKILLWDRQKDIGYIDECDLKILELALKN